MSFVLSRASLDFLLQQVSIGVDYSQLVNALDPSGLREVAGTNNNLVGSTAGTPGTFQSGPYTGYGAADTEFLRLSQTSYDSAPVVTAGYGAVGANVTDANPRTASLLISTGDTTLNPAAAEAVREFYGLAEADPLPNYDNIGSDPLIPNAGVLGGGKFNGFLVGFGQFFDHGLDFIQKGGNGTVTIPLSPNDPMWIDPSSSDYIPGVSNLMQVSRATLANPDGDFTGNVLNAGVTPIYNNNTAMDIDQSQTYGSDPSLNALLREYTDAGVVTGRVVAGHTELGPKENAGDTNYSKGLATWADIKLNALRIGIQLTDEDIGHVPMLRVDATGHILFTPNPSANWTTASVEIGPQAADDPFVRNPDGTVKMTDQPFLIDINPAANPNFHFDIDPGTGFETVYTGGLDYDAALLNSHFVAGDGRINENYMVTAVHNVFHEEHNYQVENIKNSILAENDQSLLSQWLVTGADPSVAPELLQWDGEKLFQAARLINESEYNHIAIDQFVGALYGALPEFVSYSSDINLGVSLEFSQAVFRLGHSMLNNTISILDSTSDPNNPTETVIGLMDGALNPTGFAATGAADITLGLVRQTGEEIDEFVSPAIQNTLNGQVLDLAAIDIARGRDVGLPTLNELRDQIYKGLIQNTNNTNGSALAPYQNWADLGDHLRHAGTLVNLIAAYARGGDGGFGDNIVAVRAAYEAGTATLDDIRIEAQKVIDAYTNAADPDHEAAVQFMVGTPTYHSDSHSWTFDGANQGFWDIDLWIGGLAERPLFDGPLGTTFSYILLDFAQRMQDGDRFYYLYRTPMGTSLGDEIIANQFGDLVSRATGLEHLNGDVFIAADKYFFLDGSTSLAGQAPQMTDVDGNDTDVNDYFNEALYFLDDGVTPASGGHIVIVAGEGDDFVVGGLGDDTIWGDAGNDYIAGSQGNDHLYGGAGNDFITDDENDDFIRGGSGDDIIFAGPGAIDTVFGDEGDDELHGGDGVDELLGNDGNDIIYGDGDTDSMFGGNGDDYLSGGDSVDEMFGDNGNDWMRGGVGDDHLVGGEGNDLLEGGIGPTANDGDRLIGAGGVEFPVAGTPDVGFDVASYENVDISVVADLQTSNANGTGALLDTYSGIDGVVGSRFNDSLTGAGPDTTTDNGFVNLLVGGGGDDILTGLGGDDIIVGDAVTVHSDFTIDGDPSHYTTITNWRGTGEARPDFGGSIGLGYFLGDTGTAGGDDVAVFSGNFADYDLDYITYGGYNAVRITDLNADDGDDGTDTLIGVDIARFADQDVSLANDPPALKLHAFDSGNYFDQFNTASYSNSNGVTLWTSSWTETGEATSPNSGDIQINGNRLRIADSDGTTDSIQRTANLAGALTATLSLDFSDGGLDDSSEYVTVEISSDGISFVELDRFDSSEPSGTVNHSYDISSYISANTVVRFADSIGQESTDYGYIDNVRVDFTKPAAVPNINYGTSFTEDGAAVAIAGLPGIVDDGPQLASAKIVLTNAQAGDTLNPNNISGDGINGVVDNSVAGQITINLTGIASLAAYQAAIQAVTFANNSQNPNPADRIIQVTVNDGLANSNLAISTIHVVAVNDQPNAGNDNIISNVTSGSFVVPEWALLTNDADPEGASLDITAVNESASSFSVSLTPPDLVTITHSTSSSRQFTYTVSDGAATDTGSVNVARDTSGTIGGGLGGLGNDIVVGDGGSNTFEGGLGDDIIFAGAGNDTINWNVTTLFGFDVATDGHDFIDGGAGTTDRFVINGGNSAETYRVYALADALLAGITGLNANTEIVITRNGTDNASVIAELDNIEEITINTGGGSDTVLPIGNFSPTSLSFNTITVYDSGGADTVDFTSLTSTHRVVFHAWKGNDNVNGGPGNDRIGGGIGNDVLDGNAGDDVVSGGRGHDIIVGGEGADLLYGRKGADTFIFAQGDSTVSSVDTIVDFSHKQHDKIDLSLIDADLQTDGDQAFSFIGASAFTGHAGELRIDHAQHLLLGDTDGNGAADFAVHLHTAKLGGGDFLL